MKNLPSISIVTCSLNSSPIIFTEVLESIKHQIYPKARIEHIVMDGGSLNGTISLAKNYECRVYQRVGKIDQERTKEAIMRAKNDIILFLETDNIPTSTHWLQEMVLPFIEKKEIFCTLSFHNSYSKASNLVTKYTAIFGSPDPVLFYLNKSDKAPIWKRKYDKGKIIDDNNVYFVVQFDEQTMPTLGDNGHMVRREILKKEVHQSKPFVHTDIFYELLKKGYDTVGVVKNSIIHEANPNIISMLKRRVEVKEEFTDRKEGKRKYLIFNKASRKDRSSILLFSLAAITLIFPFYESLRAYRHTQEKAVFLHPLICLLMLFGYGWSEIRRTFIKASLTL